MKRRQNKIMSLLLACVIGCAPAAQAMAASYDVSADLSSTVLFPGDILTGIAAGTILTTAEGEQTTVDSGSWENTAEDVAYQASYQAAADEASAAALSLTAAGYILTVEDGTSQTAQDGGTTGNHYTFTDEETVALEAENRSEDIAYYQSGETVTITADAPDEGYEFAGWTTDADGISFADPLSAETTFVMLDQGVTVTATYQDAVAETEAPETAAEAAADGSAGTTADVAVDGSADATTDVAVDGSADASTDVVVDGSADTTTDVVVDSSADTTTDVVVDGSADTTTDVSSDNSADTSSAQAEGSSEDLLVVTVTDSYSDGQADAAAEPSADTSSETSADSSVDVSSDAAADSASDASSDIVVVIDDGASDTSDTSVDAETAGVSLTVNYDTGAEEYLWTYTENRAAGDPVTLTAEELEGYVFTSWFVSSLNVTIEDLTAQSVTFAMPETDVVISAVYAVDSSADDGAEASSDEVISVIGESDEDGSDAETADTGNGTGNDEAVNTAAEDTGDGETTDTGNGTGDESAVNEGDGTDETSASEETPASDETPVATMHTLTVTYMAGETEVAASKTDTIEVDASVSETAPDISGYTFTGWTVSAADSTSTNSTVSNTSSGTTFSFTMPDYDVALQANYEATKYAVTVDGVAIGNYAAGDTVTVTQATASTGKVFDSWKNNNDSSITNLTSVANGQWTFTMPAGEVSLTSVFKTATYTVTVVNGTTGSGVTEADFEYGATVSIAADDAPDGMEFESWSSTGSTDVEFKNESSATTSFTMPAGDVEVTANYATLPDTYTVTVSNGLIDGTDTSGTYEKNTKITVTANTISGQEFSSWTVNDGDYDLGGQATSSTITVTVDQDLAFVANYTGEKFGVTVKNGSADYTECTASTTVTIKADTPEAGYEFDYWNVETQNTSLKNSESSTTTFTMPSAEVTVTAVYKQVTYTVTVENGSANQTSYYYGDTVTLTSYYPASGKVFSSWTTTSGNVTFADATKSTTTFTMPASNVTIAATYEDAPSASENYISGIAEGESYVANEKLTFTPIGAGMSNTDPNPGDVRYVPTSYQIGNVSNTWTSSPYETTMSIKKTGEYTLTVTFARQVWDGSSWVADGTTDTKSVTFNIVSSTESVDTGDNTPLMAVAAIAVVACVIFIILLVVFIRRRKRED